MLGLFYQDVAVDERRVVDGDDIRRGATRRCGQPHGSIGDEVQVAIRERPDADLRPPEIRELTVEPRGLAYRPLPEPRVASGEQPILEAPAVPFPAPELDTQADEEWVDNEAYRELFVSVIELAIKDFEFLQRIRRQDQLTPSERKKLRGLTEDGDPEEFFASNWFEDICRMIGVTPGVIRERLEVLAA